MLHISASTCSAEKMIVIKLKDKTLEFYDAGTLIKKYDVRVGKKPTPTPTGDGYIYEKRKRPVFRYIDPPNKGKVIKYVTLGSGKTIKVPRNKMRSLGFRINGYDTDKYSIHSTNHTDTIGKAISNGCVGMRIEDMLEFYPLIEVNTKVTIEP
ncbi:MAG TPA: murein L,D-transpeptidase [Candidatus Moranbacteria bacterium]|nr:murein L,D-transpeptidase [Candidatus Moranbacteria bacterium]